MKAQIGPEIRSDPVCGLTFDTLPQTLRVVNSFFLRKKKFFCRLHVPSDLFGKGLQGGERPLLPKPGEEGYGQLGPVEGQVFLQNVQVLAALWQI